MSRNIRTLGDFRGQDNHDSGEESGGEERQGFFVGGSEHSGQQVLGGPPRRDMREEIMDAARRAGAAEVREEDLRSNNQGPSSFAGSGARLGRTESDHVIIHDQSAGSDANARDVVTLTLNLWENGFSIEDGPLRDLRDPANQAFLTEIMQERTPRELSEMYPRRNIDLRLEKKNGPYQPPKAKPFDGSGARLGGVVPNVVSHEAAAPQLSQQESLDALAKAQADVQLDAGGAITQVQVRLQNGQRIVGKFNHSHTISAVRNFIVTAHPELAFSEFQLMTTFPNKIVEDETLSLKDAGLLNAVVVVKPVA